MNPGDRVIWWCTEDEGILYTVAFVKDEMRLIVREDGWRKWVPLYPIYPITN
jgi:hypothetical protein